MTKTDIAHQLKVDQSTISRDIKVLEELSQRFVFDLAKSDLAYYYKRSIDGIEDVSEMDGRSSKDIAACICSWVLFFVIYSAGIIR